VVRSRCPLGYAATIVVDSPRLGSLALFYLGLAQLTWSFMSHHGRAGLVRRSDVRPAVVGVAARSGTGTAAGPVTAPAPAPSPDNYYRRINLAATLFGKLQIAH
jgi:hypothetical protein